MMMMQIMGQNKLLQEQINDLVIREMAEYPSLEFRDYLQKVANINDRMDHGELAAVLTADIDSNTIPEVAIDFALKVGKMLFDEGFL